MSRPLPPPDDAAHEDGRLMHEITSVNALLGRYVLRFLDADAGRRDPVSSTDEHDLAERVSDVADGIRARAVRRGSQSKTVIEGETTGNDAD